MQVLISAEQVQRRIEEMAKDIANDFRGQPTTIVGVLTGCLMFLADLVRRLDLPLRIGLIQASSYRGATTTQAARCRSARNWCPMCAAGTCCCWTTSSTPARR